MDTSRASELDVIVVGAGVSGLTAASELKRLGKSVLVLEANDRVGGRTCSEQLGDDVVDLGGQWVGPTQHRLRAKLDSLGIKLFPQFETGKKIISWQGKLHTYSAGLPVAFWTSLWEIFRLQQKLNAYSRTLPADAPWDAENAELWDGMTLETWKQKNLRTQGARTYLDIITRAVMTVEPRDLSLLGFVSYLRWGGGFDSLINIKNGAQQDRVVGGMQQLSQALVGEVGQESVLLKRPVRAIEQEAGGVVVRGDDFRYHTKRVIVALPPPLAGRIHYSPALSVARDQLTQRMPMASCIKYIVGYKTPFWRQQGFSGEVVSDTGPTVTTFDETSHDGSQPMLVTFSDGKLARQWSEVSEEERKQEVLKELARFFGKEALTPTHYVEKNWLAEPWSRGCYVAVPAPGMLTSVGKALREPIGKIHWAGTETATEWMGYIEGAIQAGERSAREVVSAL